MKRIIDEGVAALLDGAANAAAYNTAYLAHQPASLVEVGGQHANSIDKVVPFSDFVLRAMHGAYIL